MGFFLKKFSRDLVNTRFGDRRVGSIRNYNEVFTTKPKWSLFISYYFAAHVRRTLNLSYYHAKCSVMLKNIISHINTQMSGLLFPFVLFQVLILFKIALQNHDITNKNCYWIFLNGSPNFVVKYIQSIHMLPPFHSFLFTNKRALQMASSSDSWTEQCIIPNSEKSIELIHTCPSCPSFSSR